MVLNTCHWKKIENTPVIRLTNTRSWPYLRSVICILKKFPLRTKIYFNYDLLFKTRQSDACRKHPLHKKGINALYFYSTVWVQNNVFCHFVVTGWRFKWDVLETIKFCFRFEAKQTETQSVLVVFLFVSRNPKTFFSICFGVTDRYRNNRNKPKLNMLWLFFGLLFCETPKMFFRFVLMFRTGIELTETNTTYGMGNEKSWYFNKFAAVSVGLLFVSVVSIRN